MLNATEAALVSYGLDNKIKSLAEEYSHRFLITPVWKQYGHVIEFLDSGHCWAEMTDSGSMQEELLYFPDVLSLTLRLNTDRPETILNARSNILVPPVSSEWILSMIDKAFNRNENLGIHLRNKKRIFGEPGKVSKQIIRVLKKEFEEGVTNFYPWLHQRINLWKEDQTIDYL
jgi:UDP-N-acetylglucosamine 2-epimerase (non-hydrolysing)